MICVKSLILLKEIKEIANERFGDLIKAVVDIDKKIMVIGGELHSDEEVFLIENENSENKNLWGINIYPDSDEESFIEFDSMINLKPSLGNRSRGIENEEIRKKITEIVKSLIKK